MDIAHSLARMSYNVICYWAIIFKSFTSVLVTFQRFTIRTVASFSTFRSLKVSKKAMVPIVIGKPYLSSYLNVTCAIVGVNIIDIYFCIVVLQSVGTSSFAKCCEQRVLPINLNNSYCFIGSFEKKGADLSLSFSFYGGDIYTVLECVGRECDFEKKKVFLEILFQFP